MSVILLQTIISIFTHTVHSSDSIQFSRIWILSNYFLILETNILLKFFYLALAFDFDYILLVQKKRVRDKWNLKLVKMLRAEKIV